MIVNATLTIEQRLNCGNTQNVVSMYIRSCQHYIWLCNPVRPVKNGTITYIHNNDERWFRVPVKIRKKNYKCFVKKNIVTSIEHLLYEKSFGYYRITDDLFRMKSLINISMIYWILCFSVELTL